MAKKKKDSRLDKVLARLQQTDYSTGSNGGGKKWFNAEEGDNTIRILPEVGKMEVFYQPVGTHYFPGEDRKRCYCPNFTSDGELDCPICELVHELYKAGDEASRHLAGELRVSRYWWVNVIDRNAESDGPKVYSTPVTVFSYIANLVRDPDWGEIYDVYDGVDLVVSKRKTGPKNYNVEYDTIARRKSVPLAVNEDGEPDEEQIDAWLEAASDLSWVQVSEDPEEDLELSRGYGVYVLPYDRIVKEFLADFAPPDFSDEEDEEDEEVTSQVREEIAERRSARRQRRRRAVN